MLALLPALLPDGWVGDLLVWLPVVVVVLLIALYVRFVVRLARRRDEDPPR
jgi:hypothetical protein